MARGDAFAIADVRGRRVLNSHNQWTFEFSVELADGRRGRGAAPKGETPSIYERARDESTGSMRLDDVRSLLVGRSLSQEAVDALLMERQAAWGAPAVYGLSAACFEAVRDHAPTAVEQPAAPATWPRIVFNFMNGGLHAYTNPIACDFTEFLLVPHEPDVAASIDAYVHLLAVTHERLSGMPKRFVGGNCVADLGPRTNEAACGLARELLDEAGLAGRFGLMVDASAGDWVEGDGYELPVSGERMDTAALVDWWLDLIDRSGLDLVEDPLGELDLDGWRVLHRDRPSGTAIFGDNFTSSDPARLEERAPLVDGVLLKPDQAGTVTRAFAFGDCARQLGLKLIASHRSIETDGTFLTHLATELGADWIKIGPYSDFSSVVRTNELLRYVTP